MSAPRVRMARPSTIDVLANDTDVDLDALHIVSIDTATDATKGAVSIVAGKARYNPNGQFETLAQGATATDTFRYTPADSSNVNAPTAGTVVVTVTGANDAPTLAGIEAGTLTAASGASTQVTNTLLVDDADTGAQITAAKIQITSGLTAGDTLTLPAGGSAAISAAAFDSSTGTLTLSGNDTLAHYQQALRSITYDASAAAASPPTRVVTFSVTDDHSAISNLESRTISINHVNLAPIAVDDGAAQGAVVGEDGGPVAIDVVANDVDPDLDTPLVVDPASIDTATDSTKGLVGPVDINGKIPYDPNGQFESLPEGVDGTDAFRYKVMDPGGLDSTTAAKVTVTIHGANDKPSLTGLELAHLAYNTGDTTPVTASLDVGDVDVPTVLAGATVTIGNADPADVLEFTDTAKIHGSFVSPTLTLTTVGGQSPTLADYRDALRSVAFFTPLATNSGTRTIDFQINDGASLNNLSDHATRNVDVTQFNPPPVAGDDSYSAVPNTSLVVGDTPPATPNVSVPGVSVLDNDTDVGTAHAGLTVTAGTIGTTLGGTVDMNADGTFTYLPKAGVSNTDDTFDYTLNDNSTFGGAKTDTGTVTIHVGATVPWYVDNTVAGPGDGRSNDPFKLLSGAQTASAASDVIFVYTGSGPYSGIALKANQKLLGQPAGLTVSGHALVTAGGTAPTLTNAAGNGIDLANGVDVESIKAAGSSGFGIAGASVTTATVDSASPIVNNTGGGVSLTGAAGGAITIASAITNNSGPSVKISNRSSGTTTLSGDDSDAGSGVALSANTGATINLDGQLTLSTTTHNAFAATGGGTVEAPDTHNTATTTAGTAVTVTGTTIAAAGITFQSVTAGTAALTPANGIVLNTTGASGSFSVTGTGATAQGGDASGGTIQRTTGPAISLINTKSPLFNDITITAPSGAGIRGTSVHGFTLTHSTVTGAGAAHSTSAPLDASLAFNDGATSDNIDGTVTITGNLLDQGYGGGVEISNSAGTIDNATISGNEISNVATDNASADGIALTLIGTASSVASLTKAAIDSNAINSVRNYGINVNAGNAATGGVSNVGTYGTLTGTPNAGANTIHIGSNAITGSAASKMAGFGISAGITGKGTGSFAIVNNTPITNMVGEGIGLGVAGTASADFLVSLNAITANNLLHNVGIGLGVDSNTQADSSPLDAAVAHADISNNNVSLTSGQGIQSLTRDSNGTTRLRLKDNAVGDPSGIAEPGIQVDSGVLGSPGATDVCVDIASSLAIGSGPPTASGNAPPGILLESGAANDKLGIVGLATATEAAAESLLTTQNPLSKTGVGSTFGGKRADASNVAAFTTGCTLGFP